MTGNCLRKTSAFDYFSSGFCSWVSPLLPDTNLLLFRLLYKPQVEETRPSVVCVAHLSEPQSGSACCFYPFDSFIQQCWRCGPCQASTLPSYTPNPACVYDAFLPRRIEFRHLRMLIFK